MEKVPWFRLTVYLTALYFIVTNFVLFHRPDFINVSIAFFFLIILIANCCVSGYIHAWKPPQSY